MEKFEQIVELSVEECEAVVGGSTVTSPPQTDPDGRSIFTAAGH